MGTNSKLTLQFRDRHWRLLGQNGNSYSDTGYQSTWEVSRAQPGTSGILVDYTGGNIGASFGSGTPQSRAQQFLAQIEPLMPESPAKWNGRATVDFWTALPVDEGLVLLLEGRPVPGVRRRRARALGQLPLRRRAHVDRLPGLPQRRRRERRARGAARSSATSSGAAHAGAPRRADRRVDRRLPRYSPLDGASTDNAARTRRDADRRAVARRARARAGAGRQRTGRTGRTPPAPDKKAPRLTKVALKPKAARGQGQARR